MHQYIDLEREKFINLFLNKSLPNDLLGRKEIIKCIELLDIDNTLILPTIHLLENIALLLNNILFQDTIDPSLMKIYIQILNRISSSLPLSEYKAKKILHPISQNPKLIDYFVFYANSKENLEIELLSEFIMSSSYTDDCILLSKLENTVLDIWEILKSVDIINLGIK